MVKSNLFNQFIEEEDVPEIPVEADQSQSIDSNNEQSNVSDQLESPINSDQGEPFVDSANCGQYGIKIIDDYLPMEAFQQLTGHVYNGEFPYQIGRYKVGGHNYDDESKNALRLGKWEPLKNLVNFYDWQLHHTFYINDDWLGEHKHVVSDLMQTINPLAWLRVRLTVNPALEQNLLLGGFHTDYPQHGKYEKTPIYTGIFYLNTNNGYTTFLDGFNVGSVANRLVIFPGNLYHSAVSCTDIQQRYQINVNFISSPMLMKDRLGINEPNMIKDNGVLDPDNV